MDNPWLEAARKRAGRPNKETQPEKAYRFACQHFRIPFEDQLQDHARFGKYRPDFYHEQWRLIVEVDGPTHYTKRGRQRDRIRDMALRSKGHRILHIDWRDVIADPFEVVQRIRKQAEAEGWGITEEIQARFTAQVAIA